MHLFKKIIITIALFLSMALSSWAAQDACHMNNDNMHTEIMADCHMASETKAPEHDDNMHCDQCHHCVSPVALQDFDHFSPEYHSDQYIQFHAVYSSLKVRFDTPPPTIFLEAVKLGRERNILRYF